MSDAAHHCVQLRIDLLFTMSDNLHRVIEDRRGTNSMHGRVVGGLFVARRAEARGSSPLSPFGLRRDSLRHELACPAEAAEREGWWAWEDSNFRPHAYQARALTN